MASPFNGWPDDYQQLCNTAGIKVAWYAPFASQDFGATSLRILTPEFFAEHRNIPRIRYPFHPLVHDHSRNDNDHT